MIGARLSHFRIVARLGEGGMGVVYRAEDEALRRPVALKLLPPELVRDEERRLRFLREARAAAAVTHPNIATVYEVGEVPDPSGSGAGVVFIAMELVEGRPLSAVIGGRALPVKETLRIGTEVAEALGRAHKAQVIHRDLKPDNVVIGEDGHAKILDFGLAKLLEPARSARSAGEGEAAAAGAEAGGRAGPAGRPPAVGATGDDLSKLETLSRDMTRQGRILGTAAYMSPEQARGEAVDARSDIFSLGVTLYEMVTGQVPFRGRTVTDTLSAILRDEAAPPSRRNPEVPVELERIISKCLDKSPGDRYQDSRDLAVDLRRLKQQMETGAQARAGARAGRRRIPVAAVLSAAAAMAGALAVALVLDFGGVRARLGGVGAQPRIESLAVLPLENRSGDPEQEYFSDGMTEALIAHLAKSRDLRVISRTSVMRYKGARKRLPEIGRELDVDAIVEGSVLRAGERVRITAQLVEAASDRHLWAESYERNLRDILALQADVAGAIAGEIRVTLAPPAAGGSATGGMTGAGAAAARRVNPEAYEAYLKGRHHWYKRTPEGMKLGLAFFEQAIAKDPTYAPAHAGLANAHSMLALYGHLSKAEAISRALPAARKSLELDDRLAEGHTALARILQDLDWDYAAAEVEFRKAIDLDPNYALARIWYARLLCIQRRGEECLEQGRRARELDPLSPIAIGALAQDYYLVRRYDEAIGQAREAVEIDSEHFYGHYALGVAMREKGDLRNSIAELESAVKFSGRTPWIVVELASAHARAGDRDAANLLMTELRAGAERGVEAATYLAMVHAMLAERDEAFRWLERAYERREWMLQFFLILPQFDPLRDDPRFLDLVRRMNHPAK